MCAAANTLLVRGYSYDTVRSRYAADRRVRYNRNLLLGLKHIATAFVAVVSPTKHYCT